MVLICEGSALDLDRINGYKPDGERAYCMFAPATHKAAHVPEKDFGTFVRTEDGGVIYLSDMAFKMLFDLSARARLENVKYILNEAARSGNTLPDGSYALRRPSTKRPLGAMLAQYKIRNALLPDDSRIVPHNLKALAEYDMVNMMCARAGYHSPEYTNACLDAIGFLGDYIYLGKATKSLTHLHKALTELFCTLGPGELKSFVEDFYAIVDRIPAKKYGAVAEEYARKADEERFDPEAGEEPAKKEPEIAEYGGANRDTDVKLDEMFSHKLRKISGADITGADETYAAGYCEEFYEQELKDADSQGFFEQLIVARANGGAAPIDLLSDAISREHAKDNPANMLRRSLNEIRNDIEEALEGAEKPEEEEKKAGDEKPAGEEPQASIPESPDPGIENDNGDREGGGNGGDEDGEGEGEAVEMTAEELAELFPDSPDGDEYDPYDSVPYYDDEPYYDEPYYDDPEGGEGGEE